MNFINSFIALYFVGLHPLIAQQHDLGYYTSRAKENSPLVNDNINLGKSNLLEVERLRAFYIKPQIGIAATYLFAPIVSTDNGRTRFEPNSNGANKYFGYDIGASNGGQYFAQLTLTQPLFNESRARIAGEQFQVAARINQNMAVISGHDVEKLVIDQYILCQQDMQQIRYLDQLSQMLPLQRDLVQKLVEASIYKKSDLSLLNLEYENTLAMLATFRASYRRDLMDLNVLSGINDTTLVELQPINLQLSAEPEQSVFLEKYKLDSTNLTALQNVFELKYKPQLNLIANTGLNAIYAPTIPRRFGLSAGLSFIYPIFDGHQKSITRSKTEILQKSVTFSKQNFTNQNTVRKAKILAELSSYAQRETLAQQQLAEYESLLDTYKKEILTGQLSIIIYLTTLKNRAIVQRDYALLFAQKQALINAYNYWNW